MRSFKSGFGKRFLKKYQEGTLSYKYKDKLCIKSPIDIAIYLRLIYDLKPRTIIEIGSKEGGSALLFKDIITLYDLECHIWSIDINPLTELIIPGVTFIEGDINNMEKSLTERHWASFKEPVLIVEDSEHTYDACLSCLNYFGKRMGKGDMIIIEDGILNELGLKSRYNGGPNRAIKKYLKTNRDVFEIVTEYCDMFGSNVTYNPNGYLRKL